MSFDVSKFREALGGGARANLFKISVSASPINTEGRDLLFSTMCKSASLPASTMGIIEVPFNAGRRFKLAGERTFAEWTTTLINTEDFALRRLMEDWQKAIVNTNYDSTSVGNRDLYTDASRTENAVASSLLRTPTLLVEQLDDAGKTVVKFKLHHCWPSDISTIDLSYDNTDAIEEFSVTWTYDYFTQEV